MINYIYLFDILTYMGLSEREQKIIKELVRDSRVSDTVIAKKTSIPIKTVNRIRKNLEQENRVQYFTRVPTDIASYLITITFRPGITETTYQEKFNERQWMYSSNAKNIQFEHLGQSDMKLVLIVIIQSEPTKRLKLVNDHIICALRDALGYDCIDSMTEIEMTVPIRLFKNYILNHNYVNTQIKPDWPDDHIHIDS
jgi:hypothetical protein